MILHVTNGQSAVTLLQQARIPGTYLAWEDVLHEGPVPSGLGPAAMRDRRAEFLAACGWRNYDSLMREIAARDELLEDAFDPGGQSPARADEIVLWFEHDLYDQLQLIQILDRLPVDALPRVTIVPTITYLGHEPVERYAELFATRRPLSSAEHLAARDAWAAFRSSDPRAILEARPRVTALPHLAPALTRHLQQFPSVKNGLSRTEQRTLDVVSAGVTHIRDVFVQANASEEAMFMGDSPFVYHISGLVRSNQPLLRTLEGDRFESFELSDPSTQFTCFELTEAGARVLAGQADRVSLCGIGRWLGGVQLTGRGPVWRWDSERQTVTLA